MTVNSTYGYLSAVRVYESELSPDEVAHNAAIDKRKFKLPEL